MDKNALNLKSKLSIFLLLLLGTVFVSVSCSTKKDRFANRQFQALNTKYNVLYNGNVALDKGMADLKLKYNDNFWEMLPIERMIPAEENAKPGAEQPKNANFDRAEEKATKAIQRRSMNIDGKERNPQIDEAHLLLGKSRYYENRYIPALEAFNYILYKYPESDKIYDAKIWRERTNMRLGNDALAVNNLRKLLKDIKFKNQTYADANATLAQAFLNLDVKDSALVRLKKAVVFTKSDEEKARYRFIIGQLYDNAAQKDSAYHYFQEVIDMKRDSPRRYIIEAHAWQAKQYDFEKGDTLVFLDKYAALLKDRENRPYLDVLNHQMALFYDGRKKYPQAIKYYNKSLNAKTDDKYLTASNYRNLGQLYFNSAKYQTAGQYYDSTLTYLPERSREFKAIQKKRDNLQDVVKFEGIAQRNDSILNVASLSESDRRGFYEDYIVKLKKSDEAKAKKEKELKEREERANRQSDSDEIDRPGIAKDSKTVPSKSPQSPPAGVSNAAAGSFYFYNPSTVAFGKLEFKKKWGSRALKPNWRLSASKAVEVNDAAADSTSIASAGDTKGEKPVDEKYTPEFYTKRLPTSKTVLDSLARERNFAYYQLGIIYKEKFKEYRLAATKLEQLLQNNPEERLVLPAKYQLYKIYEIIDPNKALAMKGQIVELYPDSRYAQILSKAASSQGEGDPDVVYDKLYAKYKEGDYRVLLPQIESTIEQFTGEDIIPKMELLKAGTLGKLKGFPEYKTALNYVALNYPNSSEGKDAESLLSTQVPALEARKFYAAKPENWKIIYRVNAAYTPEVKQTIDKIKKFTAERTAERLKMSLDIYTLTDDFIVIHGIPSEQKAKDIASILKDYKDYQIRTEGVVISNENYFIVQMRKNLEEYLATPYSEPLPDAPLPVAKAPEAEKAKKAAPRANQPKKNESLAKPSMSPPGMPLQPDNSDDPSDSSAKRMPAKGQEQPRKK